MLNYKVRLTEPKGYDEISVDGLYLSTDLSYISGVTDLNSNLIDGQTVMIEFNENNNFIEAVINCKKVQRQGYVIYNQKYKVIEYGGYKGYWFNDGKFYIIDENVTEKIVPTKYWVTDGKLTIDNITYDVDIELYRYPYKVNKETKIEERIDNSQIKNIDYEIYDLIFKYEIDNENPPYVIIRGNVMLPINKCNRNDWYDVIEYIIKKESDLILTVDDISCASKFPYVYYGMNNEKKYNNEEVIINGNNTKHYFKYNNGSYVTTINGNEYSLDVDRITIDGNEYIVEYEWRNVSLSETLHLFLDNVNFSFMPSQKIVVESISTLKTKIDGNNDGSFLYCGKTYYKSNDTVDYAVIINKEYEIFYTDKIWGINDDENGNLNDNAEKYGYIIIDSKPILIRINGDNYIAPYNNFNGNIKKYYYITINDKKHLIKSYEKYNYNENGDIIKIADIEYIELNETEKYLLNIDEVISNSMVRCHPIVGENGDYRSACSSIVANKHLFKFSLFNPLFNEHNVSIDSYINEYTNNESFDVIKLYNPSGFIELPLLIGNNNMSNQMQENIVENFFFKKEKENAINPIIDMEREIYYPCYNNDDNNEKILINEIVFDLHFRSRNLNDWKINEDLYTSLDETSKNALKPRCNWNLFDYYNWFENNKDETKPNLLRTDENKNFKWDETYKYYQPADLLYFLNFTDDDVFYQKSKIGKSFLRLLFFNSNDPMNQSLLYSCTVFMDENKYYKTYTDNMLNKNQEYISVIESDNTPITSNTFNISSDTSTSSNTFNISSDTSTSSVVTFDENVRLSASFHIKNRYQMSETSEGFYLYIFKEYCEKLHEEPIYLKVEFNHAGIGRTINFMMPYKITDSGYTLYDLTNENDYNEFSKGVKLNELHKKLYIPLEGVYDDVNKRYCYYMPSWMCQNSDKESVMRFNLYELKIMDESNENT